jgi:hypothetical protein
MLAGQGNMSSRRHILPAGNQGGLPGVILRLGRVQIQIPLGCSFQWTGSSCCYTLMSPTSTPTRWVQITLLQCQAPSRSNSSYTLTLCRTCMLELLLCEMVLKICANQQQEGLFSQLPAWAYGSTDMRIMKNAATPPPPLPMGRSNSCAQPECDMHATWCKKSLYNKPCSCCTVLRAVGQFC